MDYIANESQRKIFCDIGCDWGQVLDAVNGLAKKIKGIGNRPEYVELLKEKGYDVVFGDARHIEIPKADIYYIYFNSRDAKIVMEKLRQSQKGKILLLGTREPSEYEEIEGELIKFEDPIFYVKKVVL